MTSSAPEGEGPERPGRVPGIGAESRASPRAVGTIVIGRNEGERLRRCLVSVVSAGGTVVYVDSGSEDNSIAIAEALGVRVAQVNAADGFTAARARNVGFDALMEANAPDFVQFVDGDCEIVDGWIEAARRRLEQDCELAAVAGRVRERAPDASIFNRLCDLEWNTEVGITHAVGGIAMYRAAALIEVGGFNPSLICGEEPELCFRLRHAGWRIERLDRDMTVHDAAMTRWNQWIRRTERSGWGFAEGAAIHGASPERYNMREHRSLWFWGALAPGSILVLLLAATMAVSGAALWPVPLALAGLALLCVGAMVLRIALVRRARFGEPWRHVLLYGALVMLGKPVQLMGAVRYWLNRRRGEAACIIEYKAACTGHELR